MSLHSLRLVCLSLWLHVAHSSFSEFRCNSSLVTTNNHTLFTSPGYPIKYEPNMKCWWEIKSMDIGKVVVLETIDFKLQSNDGDYVSITDGETRTEQILRGSDRKFIVSEGRSLRVEFITDTLYETRGFKFTFYQKPAATPCNREFLADFGESFFTSPGYPGGYFNNLECNYTIRTKYPTYTYRVEIDLMDIDIEDSHMCQYDRLNFIDMIDNGTTEHTLGTTCGMTLSTYQSSGPTLKMQFLTNDVKTNKGFRIRYMLVDNMHNVVRSHANLLDSYIISPGYPNSYFNNMTMDWMIRATNSKRKIKLTSLDFSLSGKDPNCTRDNVEISWRMVRPLDGNAKNNETENKFDETFCGNSTPSFETVGVIWVTLTTDDSVVDRGFVMNYRLLEETPGTETCGGILAADNITRVHQSPGYPNAPLHNQTCVWTLITHDDSKIIMLEIVDLDIEFDMQHKYDSFRLFDDDKADDGKLLEIWSGQRAGEYIFSTGKSLTIKYQLDDSNNGRGFSVNYTAISRNGIDGIKNSLHFWLKAKVSDSYLSSPGFMVVFFAGLQYTYEITADRSKQIRLEVLELNLYGVLSVTTKICHFGSIKVYDGAYTSSPILAGINTGSFEICRNQEPVFVSSSNRLTVTYDTRNMHAVNKTQGFLLKYRQGDSTDFVQKRIICGGRMNATIDHNHIRSPNYPHDYIDNLHCTWDIHASDNTSMIRVRIVHVDIEASGTGCSYDSLMFYNGNNPKSSLITKLCGTQGTTVQSSGNSLKIVFKTDASNQGKGFDLEFYETKESLPCEMSSMVSYLARHYTTPGYEYNILTANSTCTWILTRSSGASAIKLTIASSSSMPGINNSCTSDFYLDIYDGSSENSLRIDRICGTIYKDYIGSGKNMFVKLHVGPSSVPGGFRIEFVLTSDSICGKRNLKAYKSHSVLTSPYYPGPYPSNLECVWQIDSDSFNYIVVMEVEHMDIDDSDGCGQEYLVAYDSYTQVSSIDRWCGTKKPRYESTGEFFSIKFHSKNTVSKSKTGFKIRYWKEYHPFNADTSEINVGAIVGGILGGLALLFMAAVGIFCLVNKPFSQRPILRTTGPSYPATVYQTGQQGVTIYQRPPVSQAHSNPTYPYQNEGHIPPVSADLTGSKSVSSDRVNTDGCGSLDPSSTRL